jgi:hypothetical protein
MKMIILITLDMPSLACVSEGIGCTYMAHRSETTGTIDYHFPPSNWYSRFRAYKEGFPYLRHPGFQRTSRDLSMIYAGAVSMTVRGVARPGRS